MANFKYGFAKDDKKDVFRILFEAISVGTYLALIDNPKYGYIKEAEI